MNKTCARCQKTVYPIEELKCLDKEWHKTCFKCYECGMILNMKNYKGFNKLPYCNAHCPQARATTVVDTPETRRLAENTKIQSQVKYHAEFEKQKGKLTQVADDPETLRIRNTSKIISNITYHGEYEKKKQMEERRTMLDNESANINNNNNNTMHSNVAVAKNSSQVSYMPTTKAVTQQHDNNNYQPPTSNPSYVPNVKVPNTNYMDNDQYRMQQQHRQLQQLQQQQLQQKQQQQQQHLQQQQQLKMLQQQQLQKQHLAYQQQQQLLQSQQQQQRNMSYQQQPEDSQKYMPTSLPYDQAMHQRQLLQQQQQQQQQQQMLAMNQMKVFRPQGLGRCVRAIYDYTAQEGDEVSFIEGDVVVNCQSIDEGWMRGTVQRTGMSGMLPANYVENL